MFVVLDTNHYRELDGNGPASALHRRLAQEHADAFITLITVQEVTQGWLAEINRRTAGRDQLRAYEQFFREIGLFADITILPFDEEAAETFHRLQSQRVRIGTMDLKIAAICLSHEALLLTRNLVDLQKVPGLRVENWLD